MKLSKSFFYTLREDVKDEDSTSGNLLVRAGFIKKSSSGVYMYMPLGLRVKDKIETIVYPPNWQTFIYAAHKFLVTLQPIISKT